jgi:hypothetical protein
MTLPPIKSGQGPADDPVITEPGRGTALHSALRRYGPTGEPIRRACSTIQAR